MPKKKSAEVDAAPPATNHEEPAGESHKKKKKKRKRMESQEGGEEEPAHDVTFTSLTSSPSPGLMSPSKKKKKRKKSLDESEVLHTTINGVEEEEEERKTKKKKKRRKSETAVEEEVVKKEEEEEEEMVVTEESILKKKKKKKKEEETVSPRKEEEEEESPKKKKKKKEKKEEEEKEEETVSPRKEEEEEEENPRKKKKKKKKQEEEEEEEAAVKLKKKKVKLQSPPLSTSTPTTTTKGKKKAKLKEEEEVEKKTEEEEEGHEGVGWTQEETCDLLDRVKQQFLNDKRTSRASLATLDWGSVAPPGYTPDATREHFMAIYKKIAQYKTLATMVDEMHNLVEAGLSDRRNRPLLPYQRFLKDFITKEMQDVAKKKGENIFRLGHDAWGNLSKEEREIYTRLYKQERTRVKAAKKPDKAIKLPKLPHQLYKDDADDHSPKGESRPLYTSLTPSQHLPYIRRSLEELIRYQADLEAHCATHPDFSPPTFPTIRKSDLKLYLESRGYPEVPPARPQLVLYRDLMQKGELEELPGLQKVNEALRRFREMSAEEQAVYKERCYKALESYKEDLQKWAEEQDEVTQFALKRYQELINTHSTKKPAKVKPTAAKLKDIFPHTAPAVLTHCPKFLGEPPRPIPSPYKLFSLKLRATYEDLSGPALQRALREGWKGLTADEVEVYESRCRLLHRQFEKEVKEYVQQMDPKNRRLYLGFNRHTLYKFFGNRDVFAEDFPNSEEYPVFLRGQKAAPASPSKSQEEEEEEEEEESEEGEEEVSVKKTTKLSPLQFSSLKLSPSSSPPKKPSSSASPSKKNTKATPPPMSDSEEEEEEVTSGSPIKKSEKKSPATKNNQPQAKSDSESSGDEGEEVAYAWLSPQVNQLKKKSPTTKKTKQPQQPPPKSDSESDEEDVAPAWLSPQVTQLKKQPPQQEKKKKKKDYSSSSSGFSD